jgi:N-acetylneuraminic acid mutarotase
MNGIARLSLTCAALSFALTASAGLTPSWPAEDGGRWSKAGETTTERTEIGAVTLGGKIYVAGGEAFGSQQTPLFQVFDPKSGQWRDLAPMPKGASHVGIAVLDGKIYVAGGFTANVHKDPRDQFIAYDPAKNEWTTLAPLSSPRGSVSLAAVGGKIHAIGGRGADGRTVGTHEIFDPKTGTWSMGAPLPTPRDHLGLVVVDGKIHVFGGRTGATIDNVGLHDVYDPGTGKWTSAAPLPTPRSSGAAVFYKGLILYYGGECKDAQARIAYDEFEGYDPKADRWRTMAKAPVPLHAEAGAVANGAAYFIGGSTGCGGDHPSKAVYAFRLP